MYTGECFLVGIIDRTFKNRKDVLTEVQGMCLSPHGHVEEGLKELAREAVQGRCPNALPDHRAFNGDQLPALPLPSFCSWRLLHRESSGVRTGSGSV